MKSKALIIISSISGSIAQLVVRALDLEARDHALVAINTAERPELAAACLAANEITRDGEWLRIQVHDNGTGIPAEKLSDIFRPFVSTKGARGTGLGLAVSRKIMRENGGDITVISEVGKGSLFTLRLPLRNLGKDESLKTSTNLPVFPPDE